MNEVTGSQQNNITSPNGNSLAVFVDSITREMKFKDVMGNIQTLSDFIDFPIIPTTLNYGIYSQIEDSVTITGTTVESSLIGAGVGSLTVPANSFSIGDSFVASLAGIISCIGSATIIIRVKTLAGTVLANSGIIPLDVSTNKAWKLDLQFTIRKLGGAGVSNISSGALFGYVRNGGNNFEGFVFSVINDTTFDTTIDNTLTVTVQWNTNDIRNSIYSNNFTLNKIF